MTENLQTAEPPTAQPHSRYRTVLRRYVYPLAVIALIGGAIWYLEYRDTSSYSPSGQRYGPVDYAAGTVPANANVDPEVGAIAPDFLLEQFDGPDLRLSDLRGKPVVLNFWATWCAPCRKEMPQFVQAYDRYKDQGLVVLAVNLQEGKGIVQPFASDFGIKFPIGIDRDGSVGDRYRLLGLPTTVFIDRDGVVRSLFTGPFQEQDRGTNVQGAIGENDLDQRIQQILAAPASVRPGG